MICTRCGSQIPADARFCSACGNPIVAPGYVPYTATPVRRIVRPRQGRVIAGVCAGIAQYIGWDVTVIRIILLVLVIFGVGTGVLAYIIGWIAMPEEPYALPPGPPPVVPPPPMA